MTRAPVTGASSHIVRLGAGCYREDGCQVPRNADSVNMRIPEAHGFSAREKHRNMLSTEVPTDTSQLDCVVHPYLVGAATHGFPRRRCGSPTTHSQARLAKSSTDSPNAFASRAMIARASGAESPSRTSTSRPAIPPSDRAMRTTMTASSAPTPQTSQRPRDNARLPVPRETNCPSWRIRSVPVSWCSTPAISRKLVSYRNTSGTSVTTSKRTLGSNRSPASHLGMLLARSAQSPGRSTPMAVGSGVVTPSHYDRGGPSPGTSHACRLTRAV